jgi:DNA-binding NarL/FixJ family response regulator
MRPRLLLADDHAIIREGLKRLLEPEFEVAGAVGDGRSLVEAYRRIRPDAVVADISMPGMNGIEAAREITRNDPAARIVLLTMHPEIMYAKAAFEAGCSGFVLKHSSGVELNTALREALAGRSYVSPLLAKELAEVLRKPAFGRELTARQQEVLQMIAEGQSTNEIAAALGVTVKAVQFHKSAIMRKLGLRNTAELTRYALQLGLAS